MPLPISLSLPSLSGERQGTLALLHLYCPFYTPSIFQANSHQQAQGHYLHYSLHKGCRDRGIAARAAKQGRGGNILLQISCCSIFGPTRSISSWPYLEKEHKEIHQSSCAPSNESTTDHVLPANVILDPLDQCIEENDHLQFIIRQIWSLKVQNFKLQRPSPTALTGFIYSRAARVHLPLEASWGPPSAAGSAFRSSTRPLPAGARPQCRCRPQQLMLAPA